MSMKGKTAVVTGGNDGIGYYTCLGLAQAGARVIMICRNEAKAKQSVTAITALSGNNKVEYIVADLSIQQQVRRAATEIAARVASVDVLINNAAGAFQQFTLSEDGYEMTIATNHLSVFLLTALLLPLMNNNSGHAKIITLTSEGHKRAVVNTKSFTAPEKYSILKAYEQSKLANVLFTFELAERLKNTGIAAVCIHPGKVKTRLGLKAAGHSLFSKMIIGAMWCFTFVFGISAKKAAGYVLELAGSHINSAVSGKYFSKNKETAAAAVAYNERERKKLWQISEEYTGQPLL